jgi:uncharacterized protein
MATITLNQQQMNDILLGATFFGSGGGGPVSVGQQIIQQILQYPKRPVLVTSTDVNDDAGMAISAFVGSPDAASSATMNYGVVAKTAYDTLDKQVSPRKPFTHVLGAEPGAGNTFIPMAVAALNNIPLVDATGATRAIPTIPLTTFAAADLRISPIVLANPDHHMTLFVEDADQADPAIRGVISNNPAFGSMGGLALWAMNGTQMKQTAVLGTVTRALALGTFIRTNAMKSPDPVGAVVNFTKGYLLGRGTVQNVVEQSMGGFDFLSIIVQLDNSKDQLYIYGQNENIFAYNTSRPGPIAMGPDSLCWLTADGTPFSNVEVSGYIGTPVALVGLPAPAQFRSPFIIQHFQSVMRQLGYAGPYVPVEKLATEN